MSAVCSGFDWVWDEGYRSTGAFLSCDNRKVSFHSDYSCGTAAIRGTKELANGQHFWEIKMTSPVYGTDMVSGSIWYPDTFDFNFQFLYSLLYYSRYVVVFVLIV